MKSLIKNNNNYYTSYVLAISNEKDFWNTRIIVFNDAYNSIKMISCYRKEKMKSFSGYKLYAESFIFDYDDSDFVTTRKWKGISSIVENDILIKKLESYDLVSVLGVEELEKFAKEVNISEWNEVITENEILVQNIINRTEGEFLRLTGDIKKNSHLNTISIAIGIMGIIVSILMSMIKI